MKAPYFTKYGAFFGEEHIKSEVRFINIFEAGAVACKSTKLHYYQSIDDSVFSKSGIRFEFCFCVGGEMKKYESPERAKVKSMNKFL
tara:strand:+ start:382 stop:642 length:261 start_codon:yes stop_codon:yes gene_type:complete